MISFFVPGAPAPQGSKSFKGVRGGHAILIESSKAVGPWRERVALAAHAHTERLLDGPVGVRLHFVLPRPKSARKGVEITIKRPDVDKLARACLDAITDVVIHDDAQVVDLHATKRLALTDLPGVHIEIREWE